MYSYERSPFQLITGIRVAESMVVAFVGTEVIVAVALVRDTTVASYPNDPTNVSGSSFETPELSSSSSASWGDLRAIGVR